MSLAIDTNLIYLQSRLKLSAEKLQTYQGKSVEEVIEAEVNAGNPLAIALAEELLTNVNLFIEIFKLADAESRYAILRNMSVQELKEFLPLMETEDLVQGLMFFTQEKLMELLKGIPPEQLVKTALEMFSKEEIIELMPEEQIDKLLTNNSLDKDKTLQHLKSIPPEYLAQMIESVTGEEAEGDVLDMVKQISQFNPHEYKDALFNLDSKQKDKLTLGLVKENPELLQLFDPSAYTHIINNEKQKPEIVKAMRVIEKDELVKMIEELPEDLMSMVITQMDPAVFADTLMNRNPQLIARLIGG